MDGYGGSPRSLNNILFIFLFGCIHRRQMLHFYLKKNTSTEIFSPDRETFQLVRSSMARRRRLAYPTWLQPSQQPFHDAHKLYTIPCVELWTGNPTNRVVGQEKRHVATRGARALQ